MLNRYCIRTGHMPIQRIRRSQLRSIRHHATQAQKVRCFTYLYSGR